jgi:hypothetical protein
MRREDPRDTVKARQLEAQSPEGAKFRLPEMMSVTGTGPCCGMIQGPR